MDKYFLNIAGEYRVCTELLRLELQASVTMGNLKGADIHVITPNRRVVIVEVKTTESNRFVTSFFQKYKTRKAAHPDFWVLCRLSKHGDEFFVLSHEEMARVQAKRNGFGARFSWAAVCEKCGGGVDNVMRSHVEEYSGDWTKILKYVEGC